MSHMTLVLVITSRFRWQHNSLIGNPPVPSLADVGLASESSYCIHVHALPEHAHLSMRTEAKRKLVS